jgi:hypothetical protein
MATTPAHRLRADALVELGALHQQAERLVELAESLHAQTSAFELFVESTHFQIDGVALSAIEGGENIARLFDVVQKEKVRYVDRMQTLALYEATIELDDAVDTVIFRERDRDDG